MARVCLAQQLECADGSRAATSRIIRAGALVVVTSPPDGYCRNLDDRLARRMAERAEYESQAIWDTVPTVDRTTMEGC
jgi:hypothetical protein